MKIIAGQYKGHNFFMPKGIRPTQNVVRKALFDILGQDLEGVTFLDLFAGSGAIGLEALSRGATKVTMVDNDPKVSEIIHQNLELLKAESISFLVINTDAFMFLKTFSGQGSHYDIIYADPPFGRDMAKKTLKTLEAYDILHDNSVIIIEHEKRETLPEESGRFLRYRQKRYSQSFLSFYKISD